MNHAFNFCVECSKNFKNKILKFYFFFGLNLYFTPRHKINLTSELLDNNDIRFSLNTENLVFYWIILTCNTTIINRRLVTVAGAKHNYENLVMQKIEYQMYSLRVSGKEFCGYFSS